MPEMIPVGNTIQPPNPQQSLNTLGSLMEFKQRQLGLQQQQQALQIGQQKLASETSGAQQAQQKNQELQALAQFTKNASQDPAYLNPDGSLNVQKFQAGASTVAPTYGQEYIGQMTTNANESIKSRQALLDLSNDQRKTAAGYLAAYAQDPASNTTSWLDTVDKMRGVSDDPGYQRAVNGLLLHAPNVGGMPDTQSAQALRQYARNAAVATAAPGAELSQPATSDYTTPGKNGQPGAIGQRQTNIMSPTPTGPVGAQVQQGLAPNQTPAYQAAISSAQARATGVAGIDVQRANDVSKGIQPSTAAIPLTQEIDSLADQINSGKFIGSIVNAAAAAGISTGTHARQILEKDLGQVQARAIQFAPTDNARDTVLKGYPVSTSDQQTIHSAMDYVRGMFKQNVARGDQLLNYQKKHPDLTGFQQADDAYTSKVNPLAAEYRSLKPGYERQDFLRRRFKSAQEAQSFVESANGP